MNKDHRLLILGSGPAGYTAAVYAARMGLEPLLISGEQIGGQLVTTTTVDNWPADFEGVQGPELMLRMRKHAERFGCEIVEDLVHSCTLTGARKWVNTQTDSYDCEALIIATGASPRMLELEHEAHYMNQGVHTCATCDGFFYRGKEVAVIGGGNTACEEALYLSKLATRVHLIHRRNTLRAEQILQKQLLAIQAPEGNVVLHWEQRVVGYEGQGGVFQGLKLEHCQTRAHHVVPLSAAFIAIGHIPNTSMFQAQLSMDAGGYLQIQGGHSSLQTMTSVPGVFAAGDVADSVYRQAITSAATGCMAALDAGAWLNQQALLK